MEQNDAIEIVGRDAQLKAIDAFGEALRDGGRGVTIRGEPGMGKSFLWSAACDRLEGAGVLVLRCRPAEAEVRFAFGALRDLLPPLVPNLDAMPVPLARAIRVAMLIEESTEAPVEPGTAETATLALLRSVAPAAPVVLAVDDAQWLDRASAKVLAYVARRIDHDQIGLLITERVEPGATRGTTVTADLAPERRQELALGPLSLGAIHRVLRSRLGVSIARPRLVRLYEIAGGNPYYALEIARAWQHEPDEARSQLPETLRGLVGRRVRRLPIDTRGVLLAVALSAGGSIDERRLARVVDVPDDAVRDALDPARTARLIAGENGVVRLAHPLLGAASVDAASAASVARTHERLAMTATSIEERGRHLSLARTPPDEDVARVLDGAALSAVTRGAAIDAAELRSLAVRFSRDDDPRLERRLVDHGEALFIAGDVAEARRRLATALDRLRDRAIRIEALILLATVTWYAGRSAEAVPYAEQALVEAGDDRDALARIHSRLSWLCDTDIPKARDHAAVALELLDADRDPALYAFALLNLAHLRLQLGEAADHSAIERGYRLQEQASIWEFSTLPGNWAKAMDDFATARRRLETYLERVRALGDESSIAQILGYLAELEAWTGNLALAREEASEAVELAEETGQRVYLIQAIRHRALVGTMSGDDRAARHDADRALELAEESGDPVLIPGALGTRALIALVDGDLASVDRLCTRATELLDGLGMRDHVHYRFHADHIEALVGLGQLERAQVNLDRHAARGALGPRPWIQATAARCRALLLAARGDIGGASAAIAEARRHHDRLAMPFELGRTLLVEGQIARRANRRRDAVLALEASIGTFESLGASRWADRARAELARVGLRRTSGDDLTPTELSVARLAADGLTNRQVASALYISPKTVEANLARAYAKLGIRSRAELGAVMAERAQA